MFGCIIHNIQKGLFIDVIYLIPYTILHFHYSCQPVLYTTCVIPGALTNHMQPSPCVTVCRQTLHFPGGLLLPVLPMIGKTSFSSFTEVLVEHPLLKFLLYFMLLLYYFGKIGHYKVPLEHKQYSMRKPLGILNQQADQQWRCFGLCCTGEPINRYNDKEL